MIVHARLEPRPPGRRRTVASDTLIILSGALVAAVVAQLAMGGGTGQVEPTETPPASEIVLGVDSGGPGPTMPPIPTVGPIVNSSVAIDATPTPIPIITLGPPTPTPSVEPSATPKPTPKPSVAPKPTPTPAPAVASFDCVPTGLTLTCTDTSTHAVTWDWDWGDPQPHDSTSTPPPHVYSSDGCYVVTLTVTNVLGHADSLSRTYPMFASPGQTC